MSNRYMAVFNTYLRRPSGPQSIMPVVGLFNIVISLLAADAGPRSWQITANPCVAIGAIFVGLGLWGRLREQLVGERRRLLPNYLGPQIIVFSVLLVALTGVWPVLLAALSRTSTIGPVACVAALFAIVGWVTVSPSPLVLALAAAGYLAFLNGVGGRLIKPEQGSLAACVLAAALVLAVGAVLRMLMMTEDDSRYAAGLSSGGWKPGIRTMAFAGGGKQYPRWWPAPRLRADALAPTGGGLIARSRRWRATIKYPWTFQAALSMLMVLYEWWFLGSFGTARMPMTAGFAPAGFFMFMPSGLLAQMWVQSWPFREVEFTRPIARHDFLWENGAAVAIHMLQSWAIFSAVFASGAALLHMFLHAAIGCLLLVSFAWQLCQFGITVWAMRYRSQPLIVLLTLPLLVPLGALGFCCEMWPDKDPVWVGGTIAGFAAVGLWLTKRASLRWLETELG